MSVVDKEIAAWSPDQKALAVEWLKQHQRWGNGQIRNKAKNPLRSTAFFLAAVSGQTLILNRNDITISHEMMEYGEHDPAIGMLVCRLAMARRSSRGDGLVIIDGGANLGTYTVLWSRFTLGWGRVIAFEPQRWPYYALCGNIAINNCYNAEAHNQALAAADHEEMICGPLYDPTKQANYGGWSLRDNPDGPKIIKCVAIDELRLPRVDIIKLDLEGYEPAALRGARTTIEIERPMILAEHPICGHERIMAELPMGYECVALGPELLCVHEAERKSNADLSAAMAEIVQHLSTMEPI